MLAMAEIDLLQGQRETGTSGDCLRCRAAHIKSLAKNMFAYR